MRMFAAVRPSPEAVQHLDTFLAVRREAAEFRWTSPEQVHLTLAFCEDVAQARIEDLVERLESAATRRTPFAAYVGGGGAFPDPDRGRVLYAGLGLDEGAEVELDRLAAGARNAASAAGVRVDGQRFRPHLTLARCGRPTGLTNWIRLLDAYRGPMWTVEEIVLVASHLGEGPRRRPRHEEVAVLPLGP